MPDVVLVQQLTYTPRVEKEIDFEFKIICDGPEVRSSVIVVSIQYIYIRLYMLRLGWLILRIQKRPMSGLFNFFVLLVRLTRTDIEDSSCSYFLP